MSVLLYSLVLAGSQAAAEPPLAQNAPVPPPVRRVMTYPPPTPPIPRPSPPPPAPPPPNAGPTVARAATPRGNPGNWVTTNDYPSAAMRMDAEGTTFFRLTINQDGRVTHCEIMQSSDNSGLDDATCRNISRRARFNPATDGAGEPIEGWYANRVRWSIPDDGPDDMQREGNVTRAFVIEADGTRTGCEVTKATGEAAWANPVGADACTAEMLYLPFRDQHGQPVRRRVIVSTTVTSAESD